MLPNSYYVASTLKIVNALKQLDIPFVCGSTPKFLPRLSW